MPPLEELMMPEPSALHWSFNYDNRRQEGRFRPALERALGDVRGVAFDPGQPARLDYEILPNNWSGYAPDRDPLAVGEASIARTPDDDGVGWEVRYRNLTAGSELTLGFRTTAGPIAVVRDQWRIDNEIASGDLHQHFGADGWVEVDGDEQLVRLRTGGQVITNGRAPADCPVVPGWTLFTGIPEPGTDLAVLDDLEKLRNDSRIVAIANGQTTFGGHSLTGYGLHGRGLTPTYWWVSGDGVVVISSNIFHTYVLRGVEQGAVS